jgi:DNA polymerase III gamma/tau subunit
MNSLTDCIHVLTCFKTGVPPLEALVSDDIMPKLKKMAEKISTAAASRIWQMLLKGTEELKFCDRPEIVLEMLLVRIAYASGLPDLRELIEGIEKKNSKPLAKNEKMPDIENCKSPESLSDEVLKMFPGAEIQ